MSALPLKANIRGPRLECPLWVISGHRIPTRSLRRHGRAARAAQSALCLGCLEVDNGLELAAVRVPSRVPGGLVRLRFAGELRGGAI